MNTQISSSSEKPFHELYQEREFYIGLSLAISSSIFIGSSFIIKKKALLRLNRYGSLRAGSGGFGYLKQVLWWAGLICMGIGELANFAAYAFAPASLVTPLGALSVLVTALMASKFLDERLNLLGKLGCFLCIIGSTIIVIHSPKEVEINDLNVLLEKVQDTTFIVYILIILTISLYIGMYLGPRIGHQHVYIYILLCSGVGSLTVMSCKALGLAMRDQFSGKSNDFGNWLPYFLIFITIIFISIQMNYLNKALDIFNTSIVTPVYYVMFTTLVITASAILFKEWKHMKPEDIIGDLCGFIVVIIAVILLNAFKDIDITMNDLSGIMRPKREILNNQTNSFDEILIRPNSTELKANYGTNTIY